MQAHTFLSAAGLSLLLATAGAQGAIVVTETFDASTDAATGYVHGQGLVENATGFGTGWSGKWRDGTAAGSYITSHQDGVAQGAGTNTRTIFRDIAPDLTSTGQMWFSLDIKKDNTTSTASLAFFAAPAGTPPTQAELLWVGSTGGFWRAGIGGASSTAIVPGAWQTLTGVIDYANDQAVIWVDLTGASYDPATGAATGSVQSYPFAHTAAIESIRLAKQGSTTVQFDNLRIATLSTDLGVALVPEPSVVLLGALGGLALIRRRRA